MKPLPPDFYRQPTLDVARSLLGKRLHCRIGGAERIYRIVETEAYRQGDPACHAFRGRTAANNALFGPAGTAYVHINYGMHHCLNTVCQDEGTAEGVLIRAIEPFPETQEAPRTAFAGPGRLTRTLGITRSAHNGCDLCDTKSPLWLSDGPPEPDNNVVVTTRVGITKAAERPWRFYVASSRLVSRR